MTAYTEVNINIVFISNQHNDALNTLACYNKTITRLKRVMKSSRHTNTKGFFL